MHPMCGKNPVKYTLLVASIIFVDQFCKILVQRAPSIQLGGFFEKTCNVNIAWSIPVEGWTLAIIWIFAFLFFLWLAKSYKWNTWLLMVIGGALSNLLDRIRFGCVIDYISFGSFPIFNIADIFISFGIIFFLFSIIKPKLKA